MTCRRSDNPLALDYWFGCVDPRPFALFRIAFALVLLQEWALRLRDFSAFMTDDGIWPHALNTNPFAWSVFNLAWTTAAAHVVHAAGLVAILCFLTGTFTRVATLCCWVFFVSLQNRNRDLSLGGDYLASILLFWSLFADLGAAFSVDARRRTASPQCVRAFGFRLLQLTPALVYLHAARLKVVLGRGAWIHGPAVYQTLMLDGWTRPLGAWLRHYPELCAFMGDGVLFMELAFFFLVVTPFAAPATRAAAIAMNLAVQLGIVFSMKVGTFTDLMITVSLLYVRPEWLDRLREKMEQMGLLRVVRVMARHVVETAPRLPRLLGRPALFGAYAALGLLFLTYAVSPASSRRIPQVLSNSLSYLNLELKVDLYSHGYAMERWEAPGRLVDGTPVDVIAVAAPGISNSVAWRFTRWTALVGNRSAEEHAKYVAQYLCRAYEDRAGGKPLRELRVIRIATAPSVPGRPRSPATRSELAREECRPAPTAHAGEVATVR